MIQHMSNTTGVVVAPHNISRSSPLDHLQDVRMSTEFADYLLAALEDERIARRLSEIIIASLHQKLDRQAEEIAELKQKGGSNGGATGGAGLYNR